jgi:predicted transcriptional regulator YdeE
MPKIEVKKHPEMSVFGLLYHGKNEAGEIPRLWGTLMERVDEVKNRDYSVHAAFGISIMGPDYEQTMVFDYIAGFVVTEMPEELLPGMGTFTIPDMSYAVITCPNLASIGKAYDAIYKWVGESTDYELDFSAGNFNFEYYGEEYSPPESEKFFIYVPVKKK